MTNPNSNLKEQLELATLIQQLQDTRAEDEDRIARSGERLAQLVLEMEQWITSGGSLPTDWTISTIPSDPIRFPANYDTFDPPPVGSAYIDQLSGLSIKRVSDALATPNADGGGMLTWIGTEYSTVCPFSGNNANFILCHQSYFGIYGATGFRIQDLPLEINSSSEPRWSRANNDEIYFLSGNRLRKYNINDRSIVTVHTFTEYSRISGKGESDISFDGDHLALVGDNRYVFIYRISTDSKSNDLDILNLGNLDAVQVTPHNNIVLSWSATGLGRYQGIELYNSDLIFQRQLTRADGHYDLTLDGQNEVMVWTNSNDPTPIANNAIVKIRLSDGLAMPLLSLDWSLAVHISCPDQSGYVFVETYAPSNPGSTNWKEYTNELLQLKLDGSRILRLAHHRSRPNVDNTYNWQPKLTCSRDGSRLLFSSNFDQPVIHQLPAQYSDVYLIAHLSV